ncbi:MAG: hypothetical protein H7267_12990 [Sandarakinorhabdus sp.]|nr:hypothetical protein [Sandarakinorhabdus sp.]
MSAFDICYPSVIRSEGGYVNNPRDNGGETNLGVTRRAWEAWTGKPASATDMRALTVAAVRPFYRAMYWNAIHGDSFAPALALCLFHCAVNAGPKRAAKMIQKVVGALPDGSIGPATIAAVNLWVATHGVRSAVSAYQNALRDFYHALPTFPTFGNGWLNRAKDVERQALEMA